MGGSKKQTIGYKYYLGAHLVVCDEADELIEIIYGERRAWSGSVTTSGRISINKPDLFGGEKREGGFAGDIDVMFGEPTQVPNGYLLSRAGSPQPAYRRLVGLVLRQCYIAANNPYVKAIWSRWRRYCKTWYTAKARIGNGANPAHILYECITRSDWGMGYPASIVDDASWQAAADTLYDEGFALHLEWSDTGSIQDFMQEVIDHIGGVIGVSPATGQFQLTLLRDDYDPDALFVADVDNIVELMDYQTADWGELTGQMTVIYTKHANWDKTSITLQNPATIQIQQAVVADTRTFRGITDDELAARVCQRELNAVSLPLAKAKLRINRKAWALLKGSVFRLIWAPQGINKIMRVVGISGGTLTDGTLTIDCVEDVFGLPSATYVKPQPIGWQDPVGTPVAASPRRLVEAPYWDIARRLSDADMASVDPTDCFLEALAGRSFSGAINYDVHTKSASASTYVEQGTGDFCPFATLTSPLVPEVSSTLLFTPGADLDLVEVGSYAYIETEAVRIDAIDLVAGTATVARGVLDTVPAAHASGVVIWFADGWQGEDETQWATGESVNCRMTTNSGIGSLDLATAPTDTLAMVGRQDKPYPPGNVKINGAAYPASVAGEITVTWAHRDRLAQLADIEPQTVGSIGPEPGTTYRLRIYSGAILKRTYTGITGTSQTYSTADETADGGPFNPIRLVLDSQRDGGYSWQAHDITVGRV
jgi:hypothetical protein